MDQERAVTKIFEVASGNEEFFPFTFYQEERFD
jgi:hypothetical protein